MGTLLEAIGNVLRPELKVAGNPIALSEQNPGSKCTAIQLRKRGPALVVRLDAAVTGDSRPANHRLFPLFVSTDGKVTASCDYLVFYPTPDRDDGCLYVFACELKSANAKGAMTQVRNGCLLARYIIEMARLHGAVHEVPTIEYRGLVFTSASRPKDGFKPERPPQYTPDPRLSDLHYTFLDCGITLQLDLLCDA